MRYLRSLTLKLVLVLGSVASYFAQSAPSISVGTTAELVAVSTPRVGLAFVSGRAVPDDGQGGIFYYNPNDLSSTNLWDIFEPSASGGKWLRTQRSIYDYLYNLGTNSIVRPLVTPPLFIPNPSNPILANAVEESLIMDGGQMDNWYRDTSNVNADIYYAYATNSLCDNWVIGNGGLPVLTGHSGGFVFKLGSIYYMSVVKESAGSVYLYSSTDKITWTVGNSGNPIVTKSAVAADWNFTLHNTAIAVVGSTWHLLVEGKNGIGGNFTTRYSSSTLAAGPQFDAGMSGASVFPGATGNAYLVSVPDRSALLALYGNLDSGTWIIKGATALTSSDLTQAASWVNAPGFGVMSVPSIHITDPTLAFTASKPFQCMIGYNYDQISGYHDYGQFTLNQFYDLITSPQITNAGSLLVGNKVEANTLSIGPSYHGLSAPVNGAMFEGNVGIRTNTTAFGLEVASNGLAVGDAGNSGAITLKGFQAGDGNGEVRFANSGGTVKWEVGMNSAIGAGFEINEGHSVNNRFYIAPGGTFSLKGPTTISNGGLTLGTIASGLAIKEGANGRMGTATLTGGTVTVANTTVTADTRVFVSRSTVGGTLGHLSTTQIASTSFTVNSSDAGDTSTINWILIEPSP